MEIFAVFGRVAMEGAQVVDAQLESVGRKAESIGSRVSNFGAGLASIGASITTGVTLPIIGAFGAAAASAVGFESSLAKIEGLVGVAADEVADFSDQILKLAPSVGQGPAALADALFFVTSAGLRGSEAMDVLEMSALAATSGMGDMTTIADLLTSAMNAYGSENLDAAQGMDILTSAIRDGKAEPQELAGAMGALLPFASELGISFDEVAAGVAAMTRTGTGAAAAGTQLRQVMATLIKPTNQAEEQLAAMGLSAQGLREQVREEGLLSVLQTLRESTNEFGEDAMAKVFPNIRALAGVLDLMGENAEENAAIFDNAANSMGLFDEAVAVAEQTTRFRLSRAMATVQTLFTSLGLTVLDVVTPAIEGLVNVLGRVIDFWLNLSEGVRRNIVVFGLIFAAVGPVLWILGKLIVLFGMMLNPVGLVVMAIGLLVTAFTTNFAGIRDTVMGVVRSLTDRFGNLEDTIQTFREAFSGKWIDNDIIMPLHRLAGWIGTIAGAFFALVTGDFNKFYRMALQAPEFMQPFLFALDSLLGILQRIGLAFRDGGLAAGFQQIADEMPNIADVVLTVGGFLYDGLVAAIEAIDWAALGRAIIQGIGFGIETAFAVAGFTLDVAGAILRWIWASLGDVDWSEVGDNIFENLRSIIGLAFDAGDIAVDAGKKVFDWLDNALRNDVDWDELGERVEAGLSTLWSNVVANTEEFDAWLRASLDLPDEGSVWREVGELLDEGLRSAWQWVDNTTEEFDAWLRASIGAPEQGSPLEEGLGKQISDILGNAFDHVEAATDQFDAWLRRSIGGKESGVVLHEGMFDAILDGIRGVDWFSLGERFGEFLAGMFSVAMRWLESNVTDPFDEWIRNLLSGDDDSDAAKEFGRRLLDAIRFGILWLFSMSGAILLALTLFFAGVFKALGLELFKWGASAVSSWWDGFVDAWDGIEEGHAERQQRVIGWFADIWDGIEEGHAERQQRFIGWWESLWDDLEKGHAERQQRVVDWFIDLWDSIITTGTNWWNSIVSIFSGVYDDVTDWVANLVTDVITFFTNLYGSGSKIVSDLVATVVGFFTELYDDGKKKIEDLVTAIVGFFEKLDIDVVTAFKGMVTAIVTEAGTIKDRVIKAVGNTRTWLVEAGKNVLRGFRDGLTDAVLNNSITNTLGNLYSRGSGLLDRGLDMQSPSGLMMEKGRDVVEGFLIGLREKAGEVDDVMAHLSDSVEDGISSRLRGFSKLTGDAEHLRDIMSGSNRFQFNARSVSEMLPDHSSRTGTMVTVNVQSGAVQVTGALAEDQDFARRLGEAISELVEDFVSEAFETEPGASRRLPGVL